MFDPFVTAVNTERATLNWYSSLVENTSNIYTPGYRERKVMFSDNLTGTQATETAYNADKGKAIPGRLSSNLFIEGKQIIRKSDSDLAAYNNNTSLTSLTVRWNIPARTFEF